MANKDKYLEDLLEDLYNFFKNKYSGKTWKFDGTQYPQACGFELPRFFGAETQTSGMGLNKEGLYLHVFYDAPDIRLADVPRCLMLRFKEGLLEATFNNYRPIQQWNLLLSGEDGARTTFLLEILIEANKLICSGIYQLERTPAEGSAT